MKPPFVLFVKLYTRPLQVAVLVALVLTGLGWFLLTYSRSVEVRTGCLSPDGMRALLAHRPRYFTLFNIESGVTERRSQSFGVPMFERTQCHWNSEPTFVLPNCDVHHFDTTGHVRKDVSAGKDLLSSSRISGHVASVISIDGSWYYNGEVHRLLCTPFDARRQPALSIDGKTVAYLCPDRLNEIIVQHIHDGLIATIPMANKVSAIAFSSKALFILDETGDCHEAILDNSDGLTTIGSID